MPGSTKRGQGVPATKSSPAQSTTSTTAFPRSGCSSSREAGRIARPAAWSVRRVDSSRLSSLRASQAATASSVAHFASSPGWKRSPGSAIQRCAPFTSMPSTSVPTSRAIESAQKGRAPRRTQSDGR